MPTPSSSTRPPAWDVDLDRRLDGPGPARFAR